MEPEPLLFQYAHADGQTSVCYSTDGSHILTCGSDGDVRMWSGQSDEDPLSECVGEMALALAFHADHFYVGTDNHYVQAYTFPNPKRDGIVCRFTAPVTHIAINKDGSKIAAGSCDMEIQLCHVTNGNAIVKMIGHKAPITGVALDPLDKYLASSSCDGSIRIWDLTTGESHITLSNLLPTCNDFFRATLLGRVDWKSDSGDVLAVPSGKKVLLYDRDSWTVKLTLSDERLISNISIVQFSYCGKYLASASTSGEIIVWNLNDQRPIRLYSHPKKVCISGIAWHPEQLTLAVCDRFGQYCVIEDILKGVVDVNEPEDKSIDELMPLDDDENAISLEDIKRQSGWVSPSKHDDASSVSDEDSRSLPAVAQKPPSLFIQKAFQPSSTPAHFQHRFMLWNVVGIVRSFNTEEEKSIDIEFHDTVFHHALHMNNYENYEMASLSSKVLALASKGSEDSPSKLTCILLNAWDGSKQWDVSLPKEECVEAVVASGKWVAVATDLQYIRIFSYSGVQKSLLSIPGPVVSTAGHDNKLAIAYHLGLGLDESQNLGVVIYEVEAGLIRTVAPPQSLPLPPNSTLKWFGFSDEGRLCSFDSRGIMRTMALDNIHWIVLSDTRLISKNPSDKYFIIGVSEQFQNMRAVLCKGSYYPMTTPRPTVVEIPFKLPLCEVDSEKSKLEEEFWKSMTCMPSLLSNGQETDQYQSEMAEMEKSLKRTVMKMFALACRGDMDLRAGDIASLMPEEQLQMAVKYASKCGKMYLAERLSHVTPIDWTQLWSQSVAQPVFAAQNNALYVDSTADHEQSTSHSQRDMFEDLSSSAAENTCLLNGSTDSPNITLTNTPICKNPFKANQKQSDGPKGLSFFDKPIPVKLAKNTELSNPALTKKVSRSKNVRKPTESQPKKVTFVQWFSTNKQELMTEFPELTMAELTKKGMTRFREVSISIKENEETQLTESMKRKLEDDDDELSRILEKTKKATSNKLSMFAYDGNK